MTPALANVLAAVSESTLATIDATGTEEVWTNWNESAVPQMLSPSPWTVQTPPLNDALPATPTAPTSVDVHVCARAGHAVNTNATTNDALEVCHFMEFRLFLLVRTSLF
jgi:hypothetical protein